MLLSHEEPNEECDAHPYWYARMIGIFHVDIIHNGPKSTSSENNGLISFGSDGLGEMFHSMLDGRLKGCTVLGSWMPTVDLVPSVFWTPLWSSAVFTLSQPLHMDKLQTFSIHLDPLQGCHSTKNVIGSTTI
jgi:hypothetical protein